MKTLKEIYPDKFNETPFEEMNVSKRSAKLFEIVEESVVSTPDPRLHKETKTEK